MKRSLISGAVLAVAFATAASAGPVTDFENAYRQMYASYRAALFKTNSGQQDASAQAIAAFGEKLAALSGTYADAPPPQYVDDPMWGETISDASGLVAKAAEEINAGNLTGAHETLEGVREVFSELHLRNQIESYSDRMNAYHAEMEIVLGTDVAELDAAKIALLREHAAVLAYLAGDVLGNPPPEAADNAQYTQLTAAFEASVTAFLDATRSGDPAAVRAALGGLKVPYSKLFVNFG